MAATVTRNVACFSQLASTQRFYHCNCFVCAHNSESRLHSLTNDAVRQEALNYGQVVTSYALSSISPNTAGEYEDAQLRAVLAQLIVDPPDSLIIIWSGVGCRRAPIQLQLSGYSYGAIAMPGCIDASAGLTPPPFLVSPS